MVLREFLCSSLRYFKAISKKTSIRFDQTIAIYRCNRLTMEIQCQSNAWGKTETNAMHLQWLSLWSLEPLKQNCTKNVLKTTKQVLLARWYNCFKKKPVYGTEKKHWADAVLRNHTQKKSLNFQVFTKRKKIGLKKEYFAYRRIEIIDHFIFQALADLSDLYSKFDKPIFDSAAIAC